MRALLVLCGASAADVNDLVVAVVCIGQGGEGMTEVELVQCDLSGLTVGQVHRQYRYVVFFCEYTSARGVKFPL